MRSNRLFLLTLFLLCSLSLLTIMPLSAQAGTTTVTVVSFSDYHSHAVPFYSEGAQNQAGIARAIAYLKAQQKAAPNLIVLDGGDMLNKTSPTWSDEYQCIEWPWLNGLVDAMALGNHDVDYGPDAFKKCQAGIKYPILSANYVGADGKSVLLADGKPYLVKAVGGLKIGLFALAGKDYASLIKKENLAPGSSFVDGVATAKQIVATLRDTEKVDAVILFGHETEEEDASLAQAVPGIDLILGTHSHYKSDLIKLPKSETYFISPFQYLTYLTHVELTFKDGKLGNVAGQLVKMDSQQPEDPDIAGMVAEKQKALQAKYPDKFQVLGTAAVELSDKNIATDEAVIGNWAMDEVRAAAGTHAFFSTSSSFRAAIPPGPITAEAFYTAIPYKNSITTCEMTGQQLVDLINLSLSKRGTDSFSQVSGIRFKVQDGKAADVQVLIDPANAAGFAPVDLAKTYKVGTTNYQALTSAIYKDLFAKASNVTDTKQDIGALLVARIKAAGTVTAALDGRMGTPVS